MKKVLYVCVFALVYFILVADSESTVGRLEPQIDWQMARAFNIVDYSNGIQATRETLNPRTWDVWLNGCTTIHDDHIADPVVTYTWIVDLGDRRSSIGGSECRRLFGFPRQGILALW